MKNEMVFVEKYDLVLTNLSTICNKIKLMNYSLEQIGQLLDLIAIHENNDKNISGWSAETLASVRKCDLYSSKFSVVGDLYKAAPYFSSYFFEDLANGDDVSAKKLLMSFAKLVWYITNRSITMNNELDKYLTGSITDNVLISAYMNDYDKVDEMKDVDLIEFIQHTTNKVQMPAVTQQVAVEPQPIPVTQVNTQPTVQPNVCSQNVAVVNNPNPQPVPQSHKNIYDNQTSKIFVPGKDGKFSLYGSVDLENPYKDQFFAEDLASKNIPFEFMTEGKCNYYDPKNKDNDALYSVLRFDDTNPSSTEYSLYVPCKDEVNTNLHFFKMIESAVADIANLNCNGMDARQVIYNNLKQMNPNGYRLFVYNRKISNEWSNGHIDTPSFMTLDKMMTQPAQPQMQNVQQPKVAQPVIETPQPKQAQDEESKVVNNIPKIEVVSKNENEANAKVVDVMGFKVPNLDHKIFGKIILNNDVNNKSYSNQTQNWLDVSVHFDDESKKYLNQFPHFGEELNYEALSQFCNTTIRQKFNEFLIDLVSGKLHPNDVLPTICHMVDHFSMDYAKMMKCDNYDIHNDARVEREVIKVFIHALNTLLPAKGIIEQPEFKIEEVVHSLYDFDVDSFNFFNGRLSNRDERQNIMVRYNKLLDLSSNMHKQLVMNNVNAFEQGGRFAYNDNQEICIVAQDCYGRFIEINLDKETVSILDSREGEELFNALGDLHTKAKREFRRASRKQVA